MQAQIFGRGGFHHGSRCSHILLASFHHGTLLNQPNIQRGYGPLRCCQRHLYPLLLLFMAIYLIPFQFLLRLLILLRGMPRGVESLHGSIRVGSTATRTGRESVMDSGRDLFGRQYAPRPVLAFHRNLLRFRHFGTRYRVSLHMFRKMQ